MAQAVQRLKAKNTAPGPDCIPGRAWVLALKDEALALKPRLRGFFKTCLEHDKFSKLWKTEKLVLIRKFRLADSPSTYRPIVLIDDVCKLFQRVIAWHLVKHLFRVGSNLADNQYSFRQLHRACDHAREDSGRESSFSGQSGIGGVFEHRQYLNCLPWTLTLTSRWQ